MQATGIITMLVLVLAAVFALTAAIIAAAPYIAIVAILGGIIWSLLEGEKPDKPAKS